MIGSLRKNEILEEMLAKEWKVLYKSKNSIIQKLKLYNTLICFVEFGEFMGIFLMYLKVFAVGGTVCFVGQILINQTKMTSGRILVTFMLLGVLLEVVGVFDAIKDFAGAGITVPIVGFGSNLAKGAMEGAKRGILGAVSGGMEAVAGGLSAAIIFGFLFALLFKSKTKKM